MHIELDLQLAEDLEQEIHYPSHQQMIKWITLTLSQNTQQTQAHLTDNIELTIRLVTSDEIQQLNKNYRHIDKATNILSFAFEAPDYIPINLLGDLIICPLIIEQEAHQQQKTITSHWAHIVIHGVLHLLGYDHIKENEAQVMESLEIKMMQALGFNNPYLSD